MGGEVSYRALLISSDRPPNPSAPALSRKGVVPKYHTPGQLLSYRQHPSRGHHPRTRHGLL